VNDLKRRALGSSWLASRLAIEPRRLDVMRRAGELVAIRPPGSSEYFYPAWQIGPDGRPHPALARIVAEARAAGLDDARLDSLMHARKGLGGKRRLADDLREGRVDDVIAAIRSR
jgi:hypothetical protein